MRLTPYFIKFNKINRLMRVDSVILWGFLICTGVKTPGQGQDVFFPENLYQGGADAFYADLGKGLQYPESATQLPFYGTILTSLKISPQGTIDEIIILNATPAIANINLQKLLPEVLTRWQSSQEQRQVILPIRYSIGGDYGKLIGLSPPESCNCLSAVVVTPGEADLEVNYLEEFNHLTGQLESSLKEEDHETSLRTLSDLIRINPFVKEFYEQRIEIERASGIKEFLCGDIVALEKLFGIIVDDQSDCDL